MFFSATVLLSQGFHRTDPNRSLKYKKVVDWKILAREHFDHLLGHQSTQNGGDGGNLRPHMSQKGLQEGILKCPDVSVNV